MGINSTIPKGSKLCVCGGIFTGVLNTPTVARYDFTNYLSVNDRENAAVNLGLAMNSNYLYFFHKINFSLSIDESTFLEAIDAGTVPTLTIRDSTNRKGLLHSPLRLFRYLENASIDDFHYNENAGAQMIGDFQALLHQVADLVGIPTIYAQVSICVYEITDARYINDYKNQAHS